MFHILFYFPIFPPTWRRWKRGITHISHIRENVKCQFPFIFLVQLHTDSDAKLTIIINYFSEKENQMTDLATPRYLETPLENPLLCRRKEAKYSSFDNFCISSISFAYVSICINFISDNFHNFTIYIIKEKEKEKERWGQGKTKKTQIVDRKKRFELGELSDIMHR